MKIAEALMLRKQLEAKVAQLTPLKQMGDNGVYTVQTKRTNVSESVDEITTQVPRITLEELTKEYDHYATELRKIDSSIQQANWAYDVEYTETKTK